MDPRYSKLAKTLCGHSAKIAQGEHVLLDLSETPAEMAEALIAEISARGAYPHAEISNPRISRALALAATPERLAVAAECALEKIKKMDAYIAIRGAANIFENSDVPQANMAKIAAAMKPAVDWRVNKTKWVVLRWPTPAMAQQAQMSSEAFEDFYFRVCTMDYDRMEEGMEAARRLMESADKVHITGPGTDLSFSIKSMPAIPCGGQYNIPDGEIFTAPVRDSVEGTVSYNAPTVYNGISFDSITLTFEKGKIVDAKAGAKTAALKKILSSDEGASRIGEFAMGFNPHITSPMRDILFDEKIAGSFHFTPGQAYENADNGNRSRIHWDMVCIQTPEWGGGEISFDGKVVRRDGLFVGEGIEKLNPQYLLG
ncbi:MAG: aminopeptidase [Verrucomicrobia bacterium CAG:312_58_20]|nr:MAG: aminopeptidase [Verrucomicrobia bacterium CAG:312_58_20]PWL64911.1 MAG: aminopeptidase [Verrucomicrobiota bacterium]